MNRLSEAENIQAIKQKAIVYCFVKQEYFLGSPGTVLKITKSGPKEFRVPPPPIPYLE